MNMNSTGPRPPENCRQGTIVAEMPMVVAHWVAEWFDGLSPSVSGGVSVLGLIATLILGAAAIYLAVRLHKAGALDSENKYEDLKAELGAATGAVRSLVRSQTASPPAEVDPIADIESPAARSELEAPLNEGERPLVARRADGKGNHPWFVVTDQARTLSVYRGGRGGGWHVKDVSQ